MIEEIQVVWSDQKNKPPLDWLKKYHPQKVLFEIHGNNSLTNRFKPKHPIKTEVRSIACVEILIELMD